MGKQRFGFRQMVLIASVLGATATHWVSANVNFNFSDRNDSDYVKVKKLSTNPFKFVFSRCHSESDCVPFGKKQGYTLEDVRIPVFKLQAKREAGRLSTAEQRDLDTLQEIINGIESPRMRYPDRAYSHAFKVTPELFIKTVDVRLGAK